MNKEYIVIHEDLEKDDTRVGIIFKSKIAGILKGIDGKTIIVLSSGYHMFIIDTYEDIIKQFV